MAQFGRMKNVLIWFLHIFALDLLLLLLPRVSGDATMTLSYSGSPLAVVSGATARPILHSRGGKFGLKFRPQGDLFLLAIVYLRYNETAVWSANRNRPVSRNATLFVDAKRDLVLADRGGSVVWSSNVAGADRMTLRPNGNLVIANRSGGVLWQSFDHPTDAIVPGQRVRAGTFLVSSVSASNSSQGIYLGGVLPGGAGFFAMAPEFYPYGILEFNPLRVLARPAYARLYKSSCNHTLIAYSQDGSSLAFQQENGTISQECRRETRGNTEGFSITVSSRPTEGGFRYLRMDPDGDLRAYLQTPSKLSVESDFFVDFFNDLCRLPNFCGPYAICNNPGARCSCPASDHFSRTPSGCRPKRALKCDPSSNRSQSLVELRGMDYFPSRYLDPMAVSLEDCKRMCLSNCSCAAAFYWQASGSCFHYRELLTMRTASDQTLLAFIKVQSDGRRGRSDAQPFPAAAAGPAGASGSGKSAWKRPGVAAGIGLGAALLFSLVLALSALRYLRRRGKIRLRGRPSDDDDRGGEDGFLRTLPALPPRFTFQELKLITSDFGRRLGSGGFGTVYEGVLADGTLVAVKQLEDTSQGYGEFRTEIATLGSFSHVNLVRLRGFCVEESHHLLVYEYMANRSLDGWLFPRDGSTSRLLDWSTRLSIALDTARGLTFLHEESRECIVHLDVKPENILLDEKFRAKLSDFGLSKLIDRSKQSRVLTGMRGTPGYLAPEWLMETGVSSKSDIYSFGIVLLELVAGRRCVDLTASAHDCYLPAAAIRRLRDGRVMESLDPRLSLDASITEEEVRRVVVVALWCTQDDPAVRPKASAVSRMLEGHTAIPEPPTISFQSALSKQRQIWLTAASGNGGASTVDQDLQESHKM